MTKTKKVKSAGRFGARYGKKIRERVTEVEIKQRKKQICSFCGHVAKRLSKGIWQCKSCKRKFSGGTFYIER